MSRLRLAVSIGAWFALCAFAPFGSSLGWRNIGPAIAGGRVAAVTGSDRDPLLYYFGAAGGGVFKTTTGGLVWKDVWPRGSVGAIGAIAIAPSDKNVVWVGTGESTPRNDASYGDGVWMTADGGAHWRWCGLPHSYAIAKIVVNPRRATDALVGVLGNPFRDSNDRGVYRTTDGGRTWHHTLFAGPRSGVSDMVADPHDPNVVYAGIWQFRRVPWTFSSGGSRDGLYKSVDGGNTWRRLRGHGLPGGRMGRIGIAIAPSNPRRVYALIQSKSALLWRSDDAGASWRPMSRDTLIDQRPFYMSRIAVDPTNADHVYFASENLIASYDGGRTFADISQAVHQDHHGLWISADGRRLIDANDGGAPISVDGGATWDWRLNVPIAQVYHVGYDDQVPYHVCAAMQDNDSYCGPSRSLSTLGITQRDWRDVANDSDGVWAWPEPGRASSVWNVGVNELTGQLGIFDLRSRQNEDITPDVTDTNGRALAGQPYRFDWQAPLAFAPQPPLTAYFGANVVFKTIDRGKTWRAISPDLTRNDPRKQQVAGGAINTDVSGAEFYDTLLDIAPSALDPNVIWVGTDDGLVQRTADGGLHWKNVTPAGIAAWGRVECVEPSRFSAARAYAVVDRHLSGDRRPYVYVTNDSGASWHSIVAGLPSDQFVHVVREDPVNPDVLYAGLEQGVWVSLDRGLRWKSLRLGMPPVSIHDLRIEPRTHDLIAGTHGRGVWILDDLTPIEGIVSAANAATPALFPIPTSYAWYLWWAGAYGTHDDECCVAAGDFSGADPPYGASISYYLPRRSASKPWIEILDESGKVERRVGVPNHAGVGRVAWDLASAPPVPWTKARKWNRGPDSGPPVVPGRFVVRLHADARSVERPLTLLPDPRAPWTQAQYVARQRFLQSLDDELSAVDAALNRLDALRAHASAARSHKIAAVYAVLTSDPVNSEDDQWAPDRLRERLTILQGDVALSQAPPLPPHLREAAAIRHDFDSAMASYRALIATVTQEKDR